MAKSSKSQGPSDELFRAISDELILRDPSIAKANMFGSTGLKVNGKIFVFLYRGQLVSKLPRERVDSLSAEGYGQHFVPGTGRAMNEWLSVPLTTELDWHELAEEAREFVISGTEGT